MTINANGDVNFANPKITAIATSSNATDVASKQYVDESIGGVRLFHLVWTLLD